MPTINAEQLLLEIFIERHPGHTQTRGTLPSGRVTYNCSCGVTLVLDTDPEQPA